MPRPRFQFRLRTLFVVVTLLAAACGYVAHEYRIVQRRNEKRENLWLVDVQWMTAESYEKHRSLPLGRPPPKISWIRQQLGDVPVYFLSLPETTSDEYAKEIQAIFPEAIVQKREHRVSL